MNNITHQETVIFYDVPLVCGAAPSIGCGSRAKPLLIDLEQQTAIQEAWLNRTGTIVGIVWHGQARTEEAAKPIFERHEVQYRERAEQIDESFRLAGSWFRGADVDRLSLEEAREIAEISVASAAKERLVSAEEAADIKAEIEAHFRDELRKFRTREELLQDIQTTFPETVFEIYQKYIGPERTAEIKARGFENPFNRAGREETSRCC
jgi:hypothetical protein